MYADRVMESEQDPNSISPDGNAWSMSLSRAHSMSDDDRVGIRASNVICIRIVRSGRHSSALLTDQV